MNAIRSEASNRTINRWLFLLGALIFSYTLTRALLAPITYDEADCYQQFVRHFKIYSSETSAVNIQLLNNFLVSICYKIFDPEEFFFRIPNLLAHILFLVYSAKLLNRAISGWIIIPCFLILNLNPYMLDFFSIARQYGLSFGMMMASIYYLYRFNADRRRIKMAGLSLLFGGLAVFSSIVQLNFFLALGGIVFILNAIEASKQNETGKISYLIKKSSAPLLIFCLVLLIIVPFGLAMKESNQLFFGMDKGFIEDTLSSVIAGSFYLQPYETYYADLAAYAAVFGVVLVSIVLVIVKWRKKQINEQSSFLGIAIWLLCISALSTILQFYTMGTLLLVYRTAIFFIILFNVLFLFLAIVCLEKNRKASSILLSTLSCIFVIHFFFCMSTQKIFEWKLDADTKNMLADLEQIQAESGKPKPIRLGISRYFQPILNFYKETKGLEWLNPLVSMPDPIEINSDYFYFYGEDYENIRMDSMTILKTYPQTGNVLAKRKFEPKSQKTVSSFFENFEHIDISVVDPMAITKKESFSGKKAFYLDKKREFGGKVEIKLDSALEGKKLIADYSLMTKTRDKDKADLRIVVTYYRGEQILGEYRQCIRDFIRTNDKWTKAQFLIALPGTIRSGDGLKAYLWNPIGQEIFIDDIKLELKEEIY